MPQHKVIRFGRRALSVASIQLPFNVESYSNCYLTRFLTTYLD